jgi:hypothetical protein
MQLRNVADARALVTALLLVLAMLALAHAAPALLPTVSAALAALVIARRFGFRVQIARMP